MDRRLLNAILNADILTTLLKANQNTDLPICQTGSIVERHSLDIFEIFIKLRPNSVRVIE